jgi:hypothetical protein
MITNRYRIMWLTVAVCALIAPAVYAAEFNNITLGRSQDFTVVTLFTTGSTQATHQMVEAKDGKPNRIVVDLTGARHDLPQNNYSNLPDGNIKSIRTSQFAVQPEPVVRVVLDLGYVAAYRLESSDGFVKVFVSAPGDPPMAQEWSAREGARQPVMATAKPAKPGIISSNPPLAQEPPAPTIIASAPTQEPAPAAQSVDVPPVAATSEPAQQTDGGQSSSDLTSVSTPASDGDPTLAESGTEAHEHIVPVPMPKSQPSQEIDYNLPVPADVQLAEQPSSEQSQPPVEETPASTTTSEQAVVASNPEPVSERAVAEYAPETSAEPMQSEPSPTVTPLEEDGSEPVASLSTLPPIPATPTDVVPVRTQISYHTMGRRDPFAPLVQSGTAYSRTGLPDVSTLRLVGILHDVESKWGLFEDANGYGYILREGDRVRNGHLAKLTQNKAYFQLTEFGWSRAVELDLEREEG